MDYLILLLEIVIIVQFIRIKHQAKEDPPPKVEKGKAVFYEPVSDNERFKKAKNITDILNG